VTALRTPASVASPFRAIKLESIPEKATAPRAPDLVSKNPLGNLRPISAFPPSHRRSRAPTRSLQTGSPLPRPGRVSQPPDRVNLSPSRADQLTHSRTGESPSLRPGEYLSFRPRDYHSFRPRDYLSAPEGRPILAQRFSAGYNGKSAPVPEGRPEPHSQSVRAHFSSMPQREAYERRGKTTVAPRPAGCQPAAIS